MLLKNIIQTKYKTNRHTMSDNGHMNCLKYVCEFDKAKLAEILFGHSRLPKKNKKQWMWKKKEKLSKSENRGLKR